MFKWSSRRTRNDNLSLNPGTGNNKTPQKELQNAMYKLLTCKRMGILRGTPPHWTWCNAATLCKLPAKHPNPESLPSRLRDTGSSRLGKDSWKQSLSSSTGLLMSLSENKSWGLLLFWDGQLMFLFLLPGCGQLAELAFCISSKP